MCLFVFLFSPQLFSLAFISQRNYFLPLWGASSNARAICFFKPRLPNQPTKNFVLFKSLKYQLNLNSLTIAQCQASFLVWTLTSYGSLLYFGWILFIFWARSLKRHSQYINFSSLYYSYSCYQFLMTEMRLQCFVMTKYLQTVSNINYHIEAILHSSLIFFSWVLPRSISSCSFSFREGQQPQVIALLYCTEFQHQQPRRLKVVLQSINRNPLIIQTEPQFSI